MGTLIELPSEILIEIVNYLGNDKPSLCNLALVHTRFRELTRYPIIRDVSFILQVPKKSNRRSGLDSKKGRSTYFGILETKTSANVITAPHREAFALFLRTINTDPSLTPHVRSVTLNWRNESLGRCQVKKLHRWSSYVLERFSNVERLSMCALEAGPHGACFTTRILHPAFLHPASASQLTSLNFKNCTVTLVALACYMTLTRLSRLSVHIIDARGMDDSMFSSLRNSVIQPSTPLSFLNLGVCNLHHTHVSKLLQIRPATRMWLNLPGQVSWVRVRGPEDIGINIMGHVSSPSQIPKCLSGLQTTLVELRLSDIYSPHYHRHDGTQMNLRHFTALEVLHAPSICFFNIEGLNVRRPGIYRLLPRSLRRFHVSLQSLVQTFAKTSTSLQLFKY